MTKMPTWRIWPLHTWWVSPGPRGSTTATRERALLRHSSVFLRLNGHVLHVPGKELYALTMQVANNEADDEVVAAYLRSRMEAG